MFLPFIGFIIAAIISFPESDFQITKGVELIENKSEPIYINTNARVYQEKKEVGELTTSSIIYFDSLINHYIVFGWIWKQSLELDSSNFQITIIKDENIRVASNRIIIGKLFKGAKGELIHESSRNSWVLGKFPFIVDTLNLNHKKPKGIFSGIHPIETITTSEGGEYYDDKSPEVEMIIGVYLFLKRNIALTILLILIILLLTFKQSVKKEFNKILEKIKRKKEDENTTANKS